MLVDTTSGSVAASYSFDAYGNLRSATGPAQALCSILGKGFYYDLEARDIAHTPTRDQRLNIWLQRDKAGELQGGVNLYQYLGGDPINLSDPNGTSTSVVTGPNLTGDVIDAALFLRYFFPDVAQTASQATGIPLSTRSVVELGTVGPFGTYLLSAPDPLARYTQIQLDTANGLTDMYLNTLNLKPA